MTIYEKTNDPTLNLIEGFSKNALLLNNLLLKRVFHDISGNLNQAYLVLELSSKNENEMKKLLQNIVFYRDGVLNLISEDNFFASKKDVYSYIENICIYKRIDFFQPDSEHPSIKEKELLHLLFFATELFPLSIEIINNSIKLSMRRDSIVHSDFIQIIKEMEETPEPILIKAQKNVITYKNIFLAIFLDYLYRNQKSLSLFRMGGADIFLSIKETGTEHILETEGILNGHESLLSQLHFAGRESFFPDQQEVSKNSEKF